MRKLLLSTMLLALVALTGQAQNKVWNDVITAHTNTSNTVTVTKVAFYDDRTEVSLHVDYVAGQWIRIMKDTFLGVDKKRYAAKRTTVLTLGEQYILPTDTLDFDIIFEPVPQDVKSINLIEPNGWQFANIRSASILPTGILNTYWRDEATGDWLIGIDRHLGTQRAAADLGKRFLKRGETFTFFADADYRAAGTGELRRSAYGSCRNHHPTVLFGHVEYLVA